MVEHIAVVHLGDALAEPDHEQNRCLLGEGTLPLDKMVKALQDSGYQGHYDVELMGEAVEHRDYQELLDQSKCAYGRLIGS